MLLLLVEELLFFDERRQSVHLTRTGGDQMIQNFTNVIQIIISALNVDELVVRDDKTVCDTHSISRLTQICIEFGATLVRLYAALAASQRRSLRKRKKKIQQTRRRRRRVGGAQFFSSGKIEGAF